MPALPLTPSQLADAERFSNAYLKWRDAQKAAGQPSNQDHFASFFGMTQGTISQYKVGKIPLNVNFLVQACKILRCAPSDISPDLAEKIEKIADSLLVMDKYEKRRLALLLITRQFGRGGISRVAAAIGKDQSYVSHMLYEKGKAGKKRIGEDSVDLLNAAFPGWESEDFDIFIKREKSKLQNHESGDSQKDSWPFQRLKKSDYDRLTEAQKEAIEDWLVSQVGSFLKPPVIKSDHNNKRIA